MWEDQNPDPGGTNVNAPSPQELSDLKDQNEQQLVLIAQLKEMLRKEQSTVSQDKVEEYVNTLNRARAKRLKLKKGDSSSSSSSTTTTSANIDANKKERVNLLRQQLEENKARLAERGKSQKGLEEMVTHFQAQLKDSQTVVSVTPLNMSLVEPKNVDYNENTSQKELYNILLTKEKKITELLNKSQKLEGTVLDLQENLKEKDSVIDARTKAITLMTDSLSKKGKNTLDALEETKDQMRKMQENFVTLEAEMKARQLTLLNDLKVKNFEISELQEINGQLEKEKTELEQRLTGRVPSPVDTLDSSDVGELKKEIVQLQSQNKDLLEKIDSVDTINEDWQNKYEEISQENAANISKLSQLELQLEEAISKVNTSDNDKIKENEILLEENQRLRAENSAISSKINELEKELEESIFKLKAFEQSEPDQGEAIKSLTNENSKLAKESSEQLAKIQELEKQLADALSDLKLLNNTGMGGSTSQSDKAEKEEIVKLKKQLDESNKNMIKMRAVQKGKIKELNKKLDQFRKMSDSNALIAQLQNEISKLNEKIAELEDDKGNLQLKMVDSSTSSKEDSTELEEENKHLKEKLNKIEQELDEKEKVIQILEGEALALKEDLKQKSEQEIKVSSQVSSEMSSICYEEQIETLELEKKKLLEQLDMLNAEKENIILELELVKKEKHDLNAKLDSYIQENMELIDKLEKLSAEKVSSAESIEIVEGLTQQEKLELAAYQKHINPEEPLKCQDDENIEPPAELNESVLQLSEDTAELLQKIEMFTQERKEVMQKMENLKEENDMLTVKVKEIENNRDILEETYEQLQNEKDALLNEKLELSEKLEKIQKNEKLEKNEEQSANVLDSELKDLQIKYEALIQENNELKRTLKEFDSVVQEKYDLENRLRDVLENNTNLDSKLNSNLDEINAYQLTIENNNSERINSAEALTKLRSQLEERENDIQELHINITELNSVISELQNKQCNFEAMESELDNLKSTLTNQITQADDYESEIAQNSETIKKLNEEVKGMHRRILELEQDLELKDGEIEKLTKDFTNKDEIIRNLQRDIDDKDQSFKVVSEDIKGKYLKLKEQLDNNDGSLQKQISELSNKNKEQLEKMKKIAANLKKKSQAYQELDEQYKNEKEKWESETKEKNDNIEALKEKIVSVTQALSDSESSLKIKLAENSLIQIEISSLREQLEILEQNNADQQHYIQELKHKQEKLQETSLQQEMSASLHEEFDTSFAQHVPDDKIRELELLLETSESELSHYKERIDRLQEEARKHQEAKSQLETINAELVEKLNLTSNSFKEKSLLEDQLELRLAEVSANEEALTKKLQESQNEREDLLKKNQENEDLIKRLKIKLKKAHDKVTELKTVQANLQDLEAANLELKTQVISLEDNQRHIQSENESLQRRNMSDYEKIEADYQVQLEELLKVKNELTTDNEKALERIKELEDREQELAMELDEYKVRLQQIEKSSVEEVNLLKEELNARSAQNQQITAELNEIQCKLQESTNQVEYLMKELNASKEQLVNFDLLQEQVDNLTSEKNNLNSALKQANDNLEKHVAEADALKQALEQYKNELEESYKKIQSLMAETERLQHKAEPNLESLQVSMPGEHPQQIPSFYWSDQPQHEQPLADWNMVGEQQNNPETFDRANRLKEVTDKYEMLVTETEDLKNQLRTSNEQLETTLLEAESLKKDVDRLTKEIHALQFAKSSLEASYESSQKPADSNALEQRPEAVVLEDISKTVMKSDQVEQPKVPLFNVFAQPTNSSVFDSFGAPSGTGDDWFSQPNKPCQEEVLGAVSIPQTSNEENSAEPTVQPPVFPSVVEDGREALLKKIKTLEFLLYSVDKEKEIALEQCTEMVNELTQIIYNQANAPPNQDDLESQILSQETVDNMASNKQSLQHTEYTPINKNCGEQATPVNEEMVQPKKAYICFDDDELPGDKKQVANIESQIVSEKDIAEASTSKKDLQKLEYERVDERVGEQKQPVVEPLAQPKHAYLCYTKDDKPQSIEAFEENDDGWGWGPEEARLEEEHISTLENIPQVKNLLVEIQQLKENIRVLQVERDNHLEEIKQLQVKSGKLIKKCKELKAKNDQAGSSKKQDEGGFFDLNETIQEELKIQIQQLEKELKDLTSEHEKEKIEKNNLLKRVDVLTAANDRMTEMKEIQDSEVLRWQRKHQEALQKLQEYKWGNDDFGDTQQAIDTHQPSTSGNADQSNKIKELEDTLKDLSLDNEELQTLLEEQTAKRLEAEKNKNTGNEEELAELRSLNEALHKELNEVKSKTSELQAEVHRILSEKDELAKEKASLETIIHNKECVIQEHTESLTKKHVDEQMSSDQEIFQEKDFIIADLQNNLKQLMNRNSELSLKDQELQRLQQGLDQNVVGQELSFQIEHLNSVIVEKENAIMNLTHYIEQLNSEKSATQNELANKLQVSEEALKKIVDEKEQIDSKYLSTMQDLHAKIMQVEEGQSIISDLQERLKEIEVFGAEKMKKDQENQSLIEQLQVKSQELEEKQRVLDELQLKVADNNQAMANRDELLRELDGKVKEIEELKSEKLTKDVEIQRLLGEVQNKELEFQERVNTLVNELNENWQGQVDQRGADVAESWKMHLEMVEKDYTTVQEKLKLDILELEDKCKILVNENDELRKNVDQEIRNEVDKMSALHQQIANLQQTINSLNQTIQDKDKRIEEIQNNLSSYQTLENELQTLRNQNAEKENKLASINIIIKTTQKQFDEKREVVEEIVSILEKQALSPISYEKRDILREFQRQLELGNGKESDISRLNQTIHDLEEKLTTVSGEKNREITGLNQVIEDLEKELSVVHEKEVEIARLSTELDNIQLEKNRIVQELNSVKQEKENVGAELEKLKAEHSNCVLHVEDCNRKVQDYYDMQLSLQQSLEERSRELNNVNEQLLQFQEGTRNDSNKEVERLNTDLANMKEEYLAVQSSFVECQNQLYEATQQLAQKTEEVQTVNQSIAQYQQSYSYYDQENNRLKELLDQREKEYNNSLEMLKNNQLADLQRHYDELLSNRDLDIATLRGQVQELINTNQGSSERLNQELALKQKFEQQLSEQTQLVDEDTKQLQELKLIIEDQVAKIEELKKELFDKSNQYDSLIAEVDVGRPPVTRQPSAAVATNSSTDMKRQHSDDGLFEPASRAELDLALYMLHQRDVRCEELTVELTQLLEERDTLQLRLSNAIREKEEIRRSMLGGNQPEPAASSSTEASPNQSISSGIGLVKDSLENEHNLATKLSELKNVGYKKDKTFVDEQEARRFQQLAIMQQHINEASKLPPEAAAKLVDASYTLSRDVQSPSKVLLNWLWGNSPPKANDS